MVSHNWPGNVRELENLIRQVVVLNSGGSIGRSMLPVTQSYAPNLPQTTAETTGHEPLTAETDHGVEPLWMTEKRAIERAIALCRGNIVAAAKQLQINPSTIYRKKASWDSQ